MSRILFPDFVTTNFNTLSLQRDEKKFDRVKIENYNKERDQLTDENRRSMVPFNSKDSEDFPHRHVLTGIQEVGVFSKAFFSPGNLKILHQNIRYEVYNSSPEKIVISKQKDEQLLEAMRRIYLQNSDNPTSVEDMKSEIVKLNELVLKDTVPRILSEVYQYKKYLVDISKIREPIKLPVNSSVTGTKLYERGPSDVLGLDVYK